MLLLFSPISITILVLYTYTNLWVRCLIYIYFIYSFLSLSLSLSVAYNVTDMFLACVFKLSNSFKFSYFSGTCWSAAGHHLGFCTTSQYINPKEDQQLFIQVAWHVLPQLLHLDLYMLSFWTWLLCFCHRFCVTHYVINSLCYCQVSIFFNVSLSIHVCLLKCVGLILFLLSVADVLLSLNLCLPIEVFYHHNQSALFTFCFISLLLLTMMY
jgi:hypothetical protein